MGLWKDGTHQCNRAQVHQRANSETRQRLKHWQNHISWLLATGGVGVEEIEESTLLHFGSFSWTNMDTDPRGCPPLQTLCRFADSNTWAGGNRLFYLFIFFFFFSFFIGMLGFVPLSVDTAQRSADVSGLILLICVF